MTERAKAFIVCALFSMSGCVSHKTLKREQDIAFKKGVTVTEERKDQECAQTLENAFKAFEAVKPPTITQKAAKKAKRSASKRIPEPCK